MQLTNSYIWNFLGLCFGIPIMTIMFISIVGTIIIGLINGYNKFINLFK